METNWNKTQALVKQKMEIGIVFRSEKHSIWQTSFWYHDTITLNADFVEKVKKCDVGIKETRTKTYVLVNTLNRTLLIY